VIDNIPTRIIFERMNAEVARGHWFFIFKNVPDLPEALISCPTLALWGEDFSPGGKCGTS
jgi:hypothetical protein